MDSTLQSNYNQLGLGVSCSVGPPEAPTTACSSLHQGQQLGLHLWSEAVKWMGSKLQWPNLHTLPLTDHLALPLHSLVLLHKCVGLEHPLFVVSLSVLSIPQGASGRLLMPRHKATVLWLLRSDWKSSIIKLYLFVTEVADKKVLSSY